ncbi:MAG: GNAT family N-acetyltransferase [Bradyrhizobium sp.]
MRFHHPPCLLVLCAIAKPAIGFLERSGRMSVVCRPARAQDLERADELVVRSINDLTERHGFGPMAAARPPVFQSFCLKDGPDGLWVAEEAGQIIGFALSWVCGDLWFLAHLFVSPDHQGRGIGDQLLQRTLDHAKKAKAANLALITFAFNTASQGLYIRNGLFPRTPVYFFTVSRDVLAARLRGAPLRCEPLESTASHLQILARIDAGTLGLSREKHHRFLIGEGAMRGVAFYAGDDCMGYAYVSSDGHIGPLAVAPQADLGAAFTTALNLAAQGGSAQVSAFLPGASEAALRIAVEHGMRIGVPMMLMSAHEFGDWTRYLPRNPGLM